MLNLKRLWVLKNEEDGAAIIFGLLLSLVGFALAYVMMLSAIQTINVANASVTTNRLQSAAETGINDALSMINSGYDFTGNTIGNTFKGKDRIIQADNTESANIRWEWWVEPIDLTNRDECVKTGTSNTFSCGYYIYSKASMPVLDQNAEVITRGILIPTPIQTATQTQTGDITYSSRGGSNFRHGVFGLNTLNAGSNVKFYSFQSVEDSTVHKPSLTPDANGLLQPGKDSLPGDVSKSSKAVSVASNQSIVLNNTANANQQVSAFNLYRSGITTNSLTPHASCMLGTDSCDGVKINEQDYAYDLSATNAWIDSLCPTYSPAASFTATSQIPMGLTCLEGDVTLDKNYIAGTSQLPSILVVKGNVTLAAGATLNPYAATQAFQLYVKDGNITNIAAENSKIQFAGTMLATSTTANKGEINLAATPNGDSITIYGAMTANKVNLGGDITVWQDLNTKYLKQGETSYYQLFSLKVVSSTRSATDTSGLSGTQLNPVVNLTANPGSDGTTLALTWSNPASNKNVPLTDYSIEISGTDNKWTAVANTPNPTYTVTGLQKYTVYNIRVKANNIYGSSQWTVIPALTQGTLPGVPQGIQLTSITNKSAILNWQAPTDNGGKAITGYKVEYSINADFSGVTTVNVANVTTTTIPNLVRSTKYYFRVSAITQQGTGAPSTAINGTTLKTVPNPPSISSVSQTNTTINVSWTAPTDDGGSAILGYNIYRGNVQINTTLISPTTFTYQMTGLTPETSYQIYVTALNALGESAKQDPATVQTVKTNPDAPQSPTNLTLSNKTTTSVTLSWTAGSGGTPSQYIVTLNGTALTTVTDPTYTITGLTPGTSYTFGVIAKNVTSQSSPTTIGHVTVPLAPSTAPTVDKAAYLISTPMIVTTPTQTCVAPATPIYKVYRNNTLAGTSSTSPITVTTSATAENSYMTYTVSCSYNAVTSLESVQSPSTLAIVKTAPSQPSNVRVTEIYGLLISLSWDAVNGATTYTVTLSTGQTITTSTNTAQITGTARNIAYNNSTTQPATEAYPTASVVAKDAYGYTSTAASISVPISRSRVFPANDYTATPSSLYTHYDTNALVSSNGDRAFVMQTDRNIVTYNLSNTQAIWAASNIVNAYPIDRWTLNTGKNFVAYRNGADGSNFAGSGVQVLIVAGGGAGGGRHGGGGGAGGVIQTTLKDVTAGSYAVTVGNGGAAVVNADAAGGNGGNSSVFGLTAIGGGGGGSWDVTRSGNTGGSGGGASWYQSTAGSVGTACQGNQGGTGSTAACGCGQSGGGGGAGAVGANAVDANSTGNASSGAGGAGIASDILGTTYYFAGGGGGGIWGNNGSTWINIKAGNGGIGGGGGGGNSSMTSGALVGIGGGSALNPGGNGVSSYNNPNGGNGGANTGGGGGGAGANPPNTNPSGASYAATSGAGGSGIVVIKYAGTPKATGGTITQVNGYTIHAFYTSGTFTLTNGPTQVYCPGGCNADVDMMVMENAGYATNYQWMGSYWRTDYIFQ